MCRVTSLLAALAAPLPAWGQDAGVESEELEDEQPEEVRDPGPPVGGSLADRDKWLAGRLQAALAARPALARAHIGVTIIDAASGRLIVSRGMDEPFQIASVAKVVTSAAALAILGPEYKYRTTLYIPQEGWDGSDTLKGDLWLRGAGDPTFTAEMLWRLVSELKMLGIRKITGSVVIDDSFFDGVTAPPLYDQRHEDNAYRAPVGAASLNYSSILLHVYPGKKGGEPVRLEPDPNSEYFVITNTTTTVETGRTSLKIAAVPKQGFPRRMELKISGTMRLDAEPVHTRKRIEHPAEYLGETLRSFLVAQGIKVGGRLVKKVAVPPTARAIASIGSEPLTVLIRDLNKFSNNFMAETLLKTIGAEAEGAPGTWEKGLTAVRAWLVGAGLKPGSFRYDNGSGLYDSNRFTPLQIVTVLRQAWRDFRFSADFISALSVAGADGTLGHRMIGGAAERYVRAKTGTLRGVSALAGYAGSVGKGTLIFAILVNDIPEAWEAGRAARSLQDEVAQAMVMYLEAVP